MRPTPAWATISTVPSAICSSRSAVMTRSIKACGSSAPGAATNWVEVLSSLGAPVSSPVSYSTSRSSVSIVESGNLIASATRQAFRWAFDFRPLSQPCFLAATFRRSEGCERGLLKMQRCDRSKRYRRPIAIRLAVPALRFFASVCSRLGSAVMSYSLAGAPINPRSEASLSGLPCRYSFCRWEYRFITRSLRRAEARSGHVSLCVSWTGRRARVYFAPLSEPLCSRKRRSGSVVIPA